MALSQSLLSNLESWRVRMAHQAMEGMEAAMEEIASRTRQNHDFQNRTGNLERSIKGGAGYSTPDKIVGTVYAGDEDITPYARYVEFAPGMRPEGTPINTLAEAARWGSWYTFLGPNVIESKSIILPTIARAMRGR